MSCETRCGFFTYAACSTLPLHQEIDHADQMANTCNNNNPIVDTVCILEKLVVWDGGHRLSG